MNKTPATITPLRPNRKPWLQAAIVATAAALLVAPLLPTASASLGDTGCFIVQATYADGGQVGKKTGPTCEPATDGVVVPPVVPTPTPTTPTPTPTEPTTPAPTPTAPTTPAPTSPAGETPENPKTPGGSTRWLNAFIEGTVLNGNLGNLTVVLHDNKPSAAQPTEYRLKLTHEDGTVVMVDQAHHYVNVHSITKVERQNWNVPKSAFTKPGRWIVQSVGYYQRPYPHTSQSGWYGLSAGTVYSVR